MAWTQSDLAAIESALMTGQLEIRQGDKMVRYQTAGEMLRVRDAMKADLVQQDARGSGRRLRGPIKIRVCKDL